MATKKKQQVVTIEELKIQIKHEKVTYWHHSPPLCGIIKTQEGYQFLPVDPSIEKTLLILFVLDPADYASERALELIEVLRARYNNLPWTPVIVFDQKYMFSKNPIFWEYFKKFQAYSTLPVYFDAYAEFREWAKINPFPKVFFFNNGKQVKEYTLDKDTRTTFLQMENDLQTLFRENDRGLPLPLLYEYEIDSPVDGHYPTRSEITMKGHWVTTSDQATTDDHNATLSIPFEGKSLRVIVSLHTTAREAASRVMVTFNDKPIHQSCVTQFLIADSHGTTSFEVTRFQGIFDLFNSKETQKGVIQLIFKNAANSPVVYWGSRIGL